MRSTSLPRFAACFAVLALLGACEKTTVQAGGKELTLVKPANQTVTRGETEEIDIKISRENLAGPVTITLEDLPSGVRVTNPDLRIPAEDDKVKVILHADPTAAVVSEHSARVTAKAEGGLSATEFFTITVKER